MRVVVVGCRGMLGSDLMRTLRDGGIDVSGYDLPDIDITRDISALDWRGAEWIVNAAAYTDVDGAENEQAAAAAVNAQGAANLALHCARAGCALLHISSDYIFDGTARIPYSEDAEPCPLNVYGRTKLDGERLVRSSGCEHLIVRTQALFGKHGSNFVRTIAERVKKGESPLRVVNDQFTCPTYTLHLARAILKLLLISARGTVNVSASGQCTWHQLALAVAQLVQPRAVIEPISSVESGRLAMRPAYSVLDKGLYERLTGGPMPHWMDGLREYAAEMGWTEKVNSGGKG